MTDPPQLLRPSSRLVHANHSPERNSRQAQDQFLTRLAPSKAVQALSVPTGTLRRCLEDAAPAEQDFAMRAAVTSKKIWDWLQELDAWTWPSEGGSAGFEASHRRTSRKLFTNDARDMSHASKEHVGFLSKDELASRQTRLQDISADMEALPVEEIKSHVLKNHICPLSNPGSPTSTRPGMPLRPYFHKMDDFSAMLTAIIIQTLPNLAKLSRLLHHWTIRFRVLRRVPLLLDSLDDADVALRSGWNAINKNSTSDEDPPLLREDYLVMQRVLEKRIVKLGKLCDYMLDCLEGLQDTLPENWLDRLERIEQDYANWVATCQRRMNRALRLQTSVHPGEEKAATPATLSAPAAKAPATPDQSESSQQCTSSPQISVPKVVIAQTPGNEPSEEDLSVVNLDGPIDDEPRIPRFLPPTPIPEEDFVSSPMKKQPALLAQSPGLQSPSVSFEEGDSQLSWLGADRRDSHVSETSTVFHHDFDDSSSDSPEISASPLVRADKIREAEYVHHSPPSSPPPSIVHSPEPSPPLSEGFPADDTVDESDVLLPHIPLGDSTLEGSTFVSEAQSPTSHRRELSGDGQLQSKINEIIESIPAKIKLVNEPPTVNLNPPGLDLPKMRKKPSIDRFRRTTSGMSTVSSRGGTPSFTLSPVKNPRRSRTQQEIKVYHLSRSNGEAPIKLHIRCVGETGERVMVRVGGGWADLSEYLKEYATHHGRRSAGKEKAEKIEVRDLPRVVSGSREHASSPALPPHQRPASALDTSSTPLAIKKTRRSVGAQDQPKLRPKTPVNYRNALQQTQDDEPLPAECTRSRSSSHLSWKDEDSSFLGLAGPSGKKVEMSDENKAWVESVKERVRLASGDRKTMAAEEQRRFGQMGKVGGTKRLFPRAESRSDKVGDAAADPLRPESRAEKKAAGKV